jgi:hypothetical protein
MPNASAAGSRCHSSKVVHITQDVICLIQYPCASLGQPDFPLRSVKQRDSKLLLELPDLPAQRRLADTQTRSRAAEVQLLCHGNRYCRCRISIVP